MRNQEAVNSKIVQRINRSRVLGEIRSAPETARTALSGRTGLSAASVSNIAGYLLQTGLIMETGRENVDRTGRKGILLRFDGSRYRIVTASLADGVLHLFLTDLQGAVYAHLEHRLLGADAEATARLLCGGVAQMLASPQAENVLAVGVSVSALVLQDGRRVTSARLGWNRMDLRARLETPGDLPVYVTNSSFAKAGWLCRLHPEWSRGLTLFVDMTHGIGSALLRDGERMDACVGEIGHSVVAPDGEVCSCGRRGCLEAMCSPARLLRLYAQSGGSAETLSDFSRRLDAGDGGAWRAGRLRRVSGRGAGQPHQSVQSRAHRAQRRGLRRLPRAARARTGGHESPRGGRAEPRRAGLRHPLRPRGSGALHGRRAVRRAVLSAL